MMYSNELANEFWDGATNAVGINADVNLAEKSLDEADKRECVRRAFRDLTVRTMEKNSTENISLDNLAKKCCDEDNGLLSSLDALFNQTHSKEDFDTWHKTACDNVIKFLKNTYQPAHCTYGKAQKIVNMTLKSLYALCVVKGIDNAYAKYFQYCHVPLDSFTLEWFYRECLKKKKQIVKGHIANWSAISEYGDEITDTYTVKTAKDSKTFYTYFYFQKAFRDWFPNSSTPTPLQKEFVIWPLIQKEVAAENFLFAWHDSISQKQKKEIRLWPLADKIKEIKKLI